MHVCIRTLFWLNHSVITMSCVKNFILGIGAATQAHAAASIHEDEPPFPFVNRQQGRINQLIKACKHGNDGMVSQLVKEGVGVNKVAQDWPLEGIDGFTPLTATAEFSKQDPTTHAKITRILLDAKANVNQGDHDHVTPLMAATNSHVSGFKNPLVKTLLDAGPRKGFLKHFCKLLINNYLTLVLIDRANACQNFGNY